MTSPPTQSTPPAPSGRAQRTGAREVAAWVAGIAATLAVAVIAAAAGAALGVFGLPALALLLLGGLLGLAAWLWRQAALALSVVGLSLAATTVVATIEPVRIAPSAGVLISEPRRASELDGAIDGAELRRGLGSVVVDLRQSTFRAGELIRFHARSDVGRVVVVLPLDRCVDVRMRATPLELDQPLVGSFATAAGSMLGLSAFEERYGFAYPELSPFVPDLTYEAITDELGPIGNGVSLFGRDFARPWQGSDDSRRPVTVSRVTGRPGAARLDVSLAAPGPMTVTALPDDVGALAAGESEGLQQVSGASWPRSTELPPSPEQSDEAGHWRKDWSRAPGELRRWRGWERRVAIAARDQAVRLAGPCAPLAERRDSWVAARYGRQQGSADSTARVISVNALGETYLGGRPGTRTAARRAGDVVAGTDLRLITASQAKTRQQTLLLSRVGVAR